MGLLEDVRRSAGGGRVPEKFDGVARGEFIRCMSPRGRDVRARG